MDETCGVLREKVPTQRADRKTGFAALRFTWRDHRSSRFIRGKIINGKNKPHEQENRVRFEPHEISRARDWLIPTLVYLARKYASTCAHRTRRAKVPSAQIDNVADKPVNLQIRLLAATETARMNHRVRRILARARASRRGQTTMTERSASSTLILKSVIISCVPQIALMHPVQAVLWTSDRAPQNEKKERERERERERATLT